VLDAADELRAIRRQAIAKLDTLTQAIFIDMFGDPAQNVHKWEECKLEDVALQVTDGEHATPPRTTAGVKLLSARNVRDGFLALEDVDYVSIETYNNLKQRCDPSAGDVLISCSGTIGRVTALDGTEPFALVRSVALVRPDADLIHPLYLEAYLQTVSMNRLMKQRANASSQANLFQNQVRSLPLFLPPQDLQRRFTSVISETRPNDDALSRSQCGLDTLFASLQQRAFRGEL
jgi:type I restriction enzyme S subunit